MTNNETPIQMFEIPNEWSYRGEGNCNIVLAIPKQKKILRIRKIEKPKSILGWLLVLINDFLHWYYGKGYKDESRDINFYLNILRPLIGNEYTSEAKQVFLSRKHVHIFKEELTKIRPEFRQNKTLQYGRAALFHDFAYLPSLDDNLQFSQNTFSVEIKPKQGWRPMKEHFLPQCLYCMNQFLKIQNKQIKTLTKYCPEELFSGDRDRMKTALNNLFQIPQNNFKIFKNGSIYYDERHKDTTILKEIFESTDSDDTLAEELSDFLQRCLTTNFSISSTKKDTYCVIHDNASHDQKLQVGSVLERILSVQMLDTEGSHSTYKKWSKNDMWENWTYVDKILEIVKNNKNGCVKCSIINASKSYEDELMFVPYLVSAIAKDCSLMITFRRVLEIPSNLHNLKNLLKTNYGYFLINIGVFDLYPKPLSTILKHYKRNKDIIKVFNKQK
ncbi:inositol-pentakisphosphate 2-kinase [Sitophilus oryzae]|uniref:Inositol-pentakisphosphate 2-kinase n=1 Tax=Sitophilus oryzae TaxID=7048 RepID=A0A6J2YFJ0_SITOR|nr:inositol-pentakisphosphate 2-kinase [Sitophilus oryzae]